MAYESPIRLVTEIENKIIEDQKEGVYKAVLAYKIDISKDELFKLLYGDRKQYEKGYADALAENEVVKHGHWEIAKFGDDEERFVNGKPVLMCSNCRVRAGSKDGHYMIITVPVPYCPYCGARMDEPAPEAAEIINDGTYSSGEEEE